MAEKTKYGIRLNKPEDVRRLIAKTINELKVDEITESKAKCIGYLCNCLVRIMEVTDLQERIEKLEEGLKNESNN